MNRYLAIPLVFTLISFCVVYCSQSTLGKSNKSDLALNAATVNGSVARSANPVSYDDAKTMILDQWPILEGYRFGSRMMPTQRLYATIGELAHLGVDSKEARESPSFLLCLHIVARALPEKAASNLTLRHGQSVAAGSNMFPIHVDRYSREVQIFADWQWQEYSSWRDTNLPKYKELAGWKNSTNDASKLNRVQN